MKKFFESPDARDATQEAKREKELAYRKELDTRSKELGVRLLLPNEELPELEVDGRFCQQREYLLGPEAPNTDAGSTLIFKEGRQRAFASWERAIPTWHGDESAVLDEMAKKFPDDPLYEGYKKSESFAACQARKIKIIKKWEQMKDEEDAIAEAA